MAKYILTALVNNHAGILAKMAGLFARRGFNIDSLAVGVTQDPDISATTIVVNGDGHTVDQVLKQLSKLIDVIEVKHLPAEQAVSRELSLIKVACDPTNRSEIVQVVNIFRAKVVDVAPDALIIELTGTGDKIDAFEQMVRPYGILEMCRTGMVAMRRSGQ